MNPDTTDSAKQEIFQKAIGMISSGMRIRYVDDTRPWGGFLVIEEEDTPLFIKKFFPHLQQQLAADKRKMSPKILLVAPHKRLSWQYHFRRAEIWRVVDGTVKVITSEDDEQKHQRTLNQGDLIELAQGERHRLVGLDNWGIVAEIWKHTDAENPSDEEDIVRLEDDFGR